MAKFRVAYWKMCDGGHGADYACVDLEASDAESAAAIVVEKILYDPYLYGGPPVEGYFTDARERIIGVQEAGVATGGILLGRGCEPDNYEDLSNPVEEE